METDMPDIIHPELSYTVQGIFMRIYNENDACTLNLPAIWSSHLLGSLDSREYNKNNYSGLRGDMQVKFQ